MSMHTHGKITIVYRSAHGWIWHLCFDHILLIDLQGWIQWLDLLSMPSAMNINVIMGYPTVILFSTIFSITHTQVHTHTCMLWQSPLHIVMNILYLCTLLFENLWGNVNWNSYSDYICNSGTWMNRHWEIENTYLILIYFLNTHYTCTTYHERGYPRRIKNQEWSKVKDI